MRRVLLVTCALAYGQDQTCVDDPNWVKNGDAPWKDCAWVAEFTPTRCAVRGADGIFALFIIINDYLRPTFLFLDVVLSTYQDLGIISSYWLYWPARFDFIFTIFNIALFDINVFEPTCWWP